MNVNDFREDLKPTRGQWERIARQWCRVAGEPEPRTRLEATELALRLERSDTPDSTSDPVAGRQAPASAREGTIPAAAADRVRIRGNRGVPSGS